jgi:hypothetical protein
MDRPLTEEKLRREHVSPLDHDAVRAEILALALTHAPQQLDSDQSAAVAEAEPIYLSEIAERLPLAGTTFGKEPGAAATGALKLLLEDVLEVARGCELLEQGADWLHDLIAGTAFLAPASRWRMVFSEIYEGKARLRQCPRAVAVGTRVSPPRIQPYGPRRSVSITCLSSALLTNSTESIAAPSWVRNCSIASFIGGGRSPHQSIT